jgi:hypothetical protein
MSRRPAIVTQADLGRAIRAAKQAGASVVEVQRDGTIRILIQASPDQQSPDPGDVVL